MSAQQPLRVMQIVSNLEVGGAQEVVRVLAEYLARAGCVSVVCSFQDGPLRADIEQLGIPVEILPQRRHAVTALPQFLMEMAQLRRQIAELVRRYEIQVIQTHLLRSLDFLALSLRWGGGPRIFWTFHNALFDLREDHLPGNTWLLKPKRFSHHLLYRLGSRWVSGMVAVSDDVKRSLQQTIPGLPLEKIHVVCNRVDLQRYGQPARRAMARASLGFSDDDHLAIMVATFKRQKGHAVLIAALPGLLAKFPRLHVLLAGDGDLRPQVEAQVRALGVQQNVHFLGTRRDIPDLLAASDSFLLPSLWEGLPMALIEAMASGLPVVATEVSGTRQVITPGVTGLLAAPGDGNQFSAQMTYLLTHPEHARQMGAAARQHVEQSHGAHLQAEETIALYQQAIGTGTHRLVALSGG